jgi:hypothetical protein
MTDPPRCTHVDTPQNMQIKLYAMGLMYSLNSRITFQQQSVADDKTAGVSGTVQHGPGPARLWGGAVRAQLTCPRVRSTPCRPDTTPVPKFR